MLFMPILLHKLLYNRFFVQVNFYELFIFKHSRCGEMADATDLKSVPAKAGYGFESHHRHPLKSDFTRENRSIWQFRRLRLVAH
jgi:hypothetical protein